MIEFLTTYGNTTLCGLLLVITFRLKRQVDYMHTHDHVVRQWLGEHDSRIDDLEASERARKEPAK